VSGFIISIVSSIFSLYKLRDVVRERVLKPKEAEIKPTLKRIVYLERTLANHAKLTLGSKSDHPGARDELL
jgi:hypothetical protein